MNKLLESLLKQYGEEVVREAIANLIYSNHVASGTLKQSIRPEVIQVADNIVLEIQMEDYGTYVDQGRRPGKQPPIRKIQEWLNIKGISKDKGAAFNIARHIGKFGIKPSYFLTNAINKVNLKYKKAISDEVTKYIKTQIKLK